MRISRGNEVIGEWSAGQIKKRIAEASLFSTDSFYDEDSSEWLPLSDLLAKQAAPKPVKAIGRACYCGSSVPFSLCCGDGSNY